MKLLSIVLHTDARQDLLELLRGSQNVPGYTLSAVEGWGTEIDRDSFVSAKERSTGHVPRIRVDILLEDNAVDGVIAEIRERAANSLGQGMYWVIPAEQGGHFL